VQLGHGTDLAYFVLALLNGLTEDVLMTLMKNFKGVAPGEYLLHGHEGIAPMPEVTRGSANRTATPSLIQNNL